VDAATYVTERDGGVIGMVTLWVFSTLTGPKAYLIERGPLALLAST
jgi:hypothetical protein